MLLAVSCKFFLENSDKDSSLVCPAFLMAQAFICDTVKAVSLVPRYVGVQLLFLK